MDILRQHLFEALQNTTTGDAAIDDTNLNASYHIVGILKKHEEAMAKIELNRNHYTAEGKDIKRNEAAKESMKELQEVQEKSSWQVDIDKVEKKFDIIADKTDLQVLIEESRQREIRSAMRKIGDDSLLLESNFGQQIRDGDRDICGAIVNSPLPLSLHPDLFKTANEQYRLSKNPTAASRLNTLTQAQDIHNSLFNFARVELGENAVDNIADLASGKPLTEAMARDVKIE